MLQNDPLQPPNRPAQEGEGHTKRMMVMDMLRVDVDGGKYTVVQSANGGAHVLRYGEVWLESLPAGSKCWLSMAYEIEELRAEVVKLKDDNNAAT